MDRTCFTHSKPDFLVAQQAVRPHWLVVLGHDQGCTGTHHPANQHQNTCKVQRSRQLWMLGRWLQNGMIQAISPRTLARYQTLLHLLTTVCATLNMSTDYCFCSQIRMLHVEQFVFLYKNFNWTNLWFIYLMCVHARTGGVFVYYNGLLLVS